MGSEVQTRLRRVMFENPYHSQLKVDGWCLCDCGYYWFNNVGGDFQDFWQKQRRQASEYLKIQIANWTNIETKEILTFNAPYDMSITINILQDYWQY